MSSQQQQQQKQKKEPLHCRGCDAIIVFDPKRRKPDGIGWIRLNPDKSVHECKPKQEDQQQTQQQAQQVAAGPQKTGFTPSTNTETLSVEEKLDTILNRIETLQKTMDLILKK